MSKAFEGKLRVQERGMRSPSSPLNGISVSQDTLDLLPAPLLVLRVQ